jgi:DNA-binding winged helix-turn-helix (wHTH) protein/Flp pilus assembly protein TadD
MTNWHLWQFGEYELDEHTRTLRRNGETVALNRRAFDVLLYFARNPGKVLSKEELLENVWPDAHVDEASLRQSISVLRRALEDRPGESGYILTVPGRGYQFTSTVEAPASRAAPAVSAEAEIADALLAPEDQGGAALPQAPAPLARRLGRGRLWLAAAVILLLAATFLAAWGFHRRNSFQLTAKDVLLVADFENTTGEGVFDEALRQALLVSLQQSPNVQVLSDRKSAVLLKQMGHSSEDRITGTLGFELCQRIGAKALLQGSIAKIGSAYLVGLAAIRCENGTLIAHEQVEANQREEVVDALGKAAEKLRSRLGESLPSIRRYNAPLEQATTPSLDALRTYGMALSTWDRQGDLASIPLFKKAVEIDPNFAMAYGALAVLYHNLGDSEQARDNAAHAFRLRDRVTEVEKDAIDARYYLYVTGEIDKAAEVYARHVEKYPDAAGGFNQLGHAYLLLGKPEQAAFALRQAMSLASDRASTYANLAASLLILGKLDEADAVLKQAADRKLQTGTVLQVSYWRYFLRKDEAGMARVLDQASKIPGAESSLLSAKASTEAYHGRFRQALETSTSAAKLMEKDGDKASAAVCLAQAAVWQAEAGSAAGARSLAAQAQKMSDAREVRTLTALVDALTGNSRQALATSDELDRQNPSATFIQGYWLPLLRAEVAIQRGDGAKAVPMLRAAEPLEAAMPDDFQVGTLYPAYARGQAYLLSGDGSAAAAEFQKLIDRPGVVMNQPLGALAHLQLARAYRLEGESSRALDSYQDFLALWKEADRDTPTFLKARSEFPSIADRTRRHSD